MAWFRHILQVTALVCCLIGSEAKAHHDLQCQTTKSGRKPHYAIFLIHGLAGDERTFGSAGQAMTAHMSEVLPCYDYSYHNLIYSTGTAQSSPMLFYKEIGQQIERIYADLPGGPGPEDKLSLVGHSQGGLVAMLWYFMSLRDPSHERRELSQRTDAIVAVGSPFWGSEVAAFGKKIWTAVPFFDQLAENWNVSADELEALSPISELTERFRDFAISLSEKRSRKSWVHFRPLFLAGVPYRSDAAQLEGIEHTVNRWVLTQAEKYGFGGERHETDMAVEVPGARADFYYCRDQGPMISRACFQRTRFLEGEDELPFVLLEALHASPSPERIYDMARIPAKCLNPSECDHPVYPLVLGHLLDCGGRRRGMCELGPYERIMDGLRGHLLRQQQPAISGDLLEQMQGFIIELNLHVPNNYPFPEGGDKKLAEFVRSYIRFPRPNRSWRFPPMLRIAGVGLWNSENDLPLDDTSGLYEIFVGRDKEWLSVLARVSDQNYRGERQRSLRVQLRGIVRPEEVRGLGTDGIRERRILYLQKIEQGVPLPFKIQMPGLKPVTVEAIVRPTYSTYFETTLERGF